MKSFGLKLLGILKEYLPRIRARLAADLRVTTEHARTAILKLRVLANRARAEMAEMRPPVRYALYARVVNCLRQVEDQSLAMVREIESQAKRLQAYIDIAETAHRLSRDTRPALTAALEVLDNDRYWTRGKENRMFLATRQACVLAKLAYSSGQHELATAAYLKAQQFDHMIKNTDSRIGLAIALADVAAHLKVCFDQSAWLTVAMELASGIREPKERIGAVKFVARHMVMSQVPPTDDAAADRRFSVAGQAPKRPKSVMIENGTEISATVQATGPEDEIQFNIMG